MQGRAPGPRTATQNPFLPFAVVSQTPASLPCNSPSELSRLLKPYTHVALFSAPPLPSILPPPLSPAPPPPTPPVQDGYILCKECIPEDLMSFQTYIIQACFPQRTGYKKCVREGECTLRVHKSAKVVMYICFRTAFYFPGHFL